MTESIDRAAIKARAEAATPGPWSYRPEILGLPNTTVMAENGQVGYVAVGHFLSPDAEFIAHAREDIPALLAALEEAEREVAKITENRNEWAHRAMNIKHALGRAERRIAAVEAAIANQPVFTNDGYGGLRMYGHADFMSDLRAALHPVAETTEAEEE